MPTTTSTTTDVSLTVAELRLLRSAVLDRIAARSGRTHQAVMNAMVDLDDKLEKALEEAGDLSF